MIYYSIIPKKISEIIVTHSNFSDLTDVECIINFKDMKGNIISSKNFKKKYPFSHSIKNNNSSDVYLELMFLTDGSILLNGGTFNLFYKTKIGSFAIEYGCIGENCNDLEKGTIKTSIVKNSCFISKTNNTSIFIINPNPQKSHKTSRLGDVFYKIFQENGNLIHEENLKVKPDHMVKIDLKQKLFGKTYNKNSPSLFTFVSKNNFNVFPMTFLMNKNYPTGCEHSQPRFAYYRQPANGPQNIKYNILKLFNNLIK